MTARPIPISALRVPTASATVAAYTIQNIAVSMDDHAIDSENVPRRQVLGATCNE
jgi:hypothetical protein